MVDLLASMAPRIVDHAHAGPTPAAKPAVTSTRSPSPAMLRLAHKALNELTNNDAAFVATLAQSERTAASATRSEARHRRLIAQVQHVRAKVPVRILSDRGLSPEVLDALSSSAQRTLSDREARIRTRRARQAIRSEMAVPCGRLVDELRRLVAAVTAQRASDPTLPSITSPYAPTPARARKPARKPADPSPVA